MKLKDSFHPYALATIACWSISYVMTGLCMEHFTSAALGCLRYLIAVPVLLIIIFTMKVKPPQWKDVPWFIAAGASGFFLYMIIFNVGASMVTSATSSIIIAMAPVLTALFAAVLYREKLKAYQWIAVVIEFLGIIILTLTGSSFSANQGILWLFIAAVLLSTYNLIQRKLTKQYTALQVSVYSILWGTLMLAIFSPGAIRQAVTAPPLLMFYVALMGIFSSAIAYVLWTVAFSKAEKTSQVSNYMFGTPFLAGALGFVMAGEAPTPSVIVGGIIIIAGIILFNKEGFSKKEVIKNESIVN